MKVRRQDSPCKNVLEWMEINGIYLTWNPSPKTKKPWLWDHQTRVSKKFHHSTHLELQNPSLFQRKTPPKVREAIPSNKGNSARSNSSGRAFCCGCPAVRSRPSRPWYYSSVVQWEGWNITSEKQNKQIMLILPPNMIRHGKNKIK